MVEETEDLCEAINLSQNTTVPVVVAIADTLGALEVGLSKRVKKVEFHPRVAEALQRLPKQAQEKLQLDFIASRAGAKL